MKRFQNILVGIELHPTEEFTHARPVPASLAALERAIELAKTNGARLTLFSAVGLLGPSPLITPDQIETARRNIHKSATEALAQLLQEVEAKGVKPRSRVAFGRGWLEIVRQVLVERHDLVIVGSREISELKRVIVGSTAAKLLRKCPCAVWVTKPQPALEISTILAATDFGDVSKFASGLATSLAHIHSAQLHLLHCAEYPSEIALKWGLVPSEYRNDYRQRVYAEAKHQFDLELNRPEFDGLAKRPHVHLKSGMSPHDAILEAIDERDVDLLVMGTLARGGIRGLLIGNTAEQVLPHVSCSVLAVKPSDFICPVEVSPDRQQELSRVQIATDPA